MLLDRLAGRPSEIDVINGAIPPRAAALGLEAPVNATIAALRSNSVGSGPIDGFMIDTRVSTCR